MKKVILLIFAFCTTVLSAQVDRAKQPEPGPAPEINLKEPQRFDLMNGLKVMVVENHKLPRVSVQLRIDNPPILEGDKAGVSSMTASLLGKGSKTIAKDDFEEEVDYLGARISFGSQSAFASSLSKYFPRVLELMADAALNPNFTQEEFDKEREKLLTGLKGQEKDAGAIASRVQNALAYGTDHPYGEVTSETSVNNIELKDVAEFYRNYFVPANAYLVIIGDINFEETKELVETHFTSWTKAVPPSFSFSKPTEPSYTQINFVDVPNAVQSEVSVQNLVDLKMADKDYLAALLANQVLGGGAQGRLFQNLREDKAFTYGSYSGIGNDRFVPSTFSASASVRNAVTDSAVVEILSEVDKIIKQPVTEQELQNAKSIYIGGFVMALERPETMARYAINLAAEDLPNDFYQNYLENINAVTVEDVQQAAQKYFTSDKARVVVSGKGSEVLENLESLKFDGKEVPVKYFDKYASPTEKPNYEAAIPEGMVVNDVLNKYIDAIGGIEKLNGVESYSVMAEAEAQGMKLDLEMKKTSKNQFMQDVITLEGVESVNGKNAFKVKVSDEKTSFYDMESGLKVQDVTNAEVQGQQMTSIISYNNYQEVSGILFPFSIGQTMGPQSFEFIVKELKVNEGVTDADFE